jgi:predicted  nucleic acid-binding Zn-ribbon protein
MDERLEELESIVDQLNDTSTQPAKKETALNASKTEIKKLTDHIQAVEKQLHAAIGAKHKSSIHDEYKDRTPSVHSLFLSIEGFRKRLRSLEEMEGVTKCAQFLK